MPVEYCSQIENRSQITGDVPAGGRFWKCSITGKACVGSKQVDRDSMDVNDHDEYDVGAARRCPAYNADEKLAKYLKAHILHAEADELEGLAKEKEKEARGLLEEIKKMES